MLRNLEPRERAGFNHPLELGSDSMFSMPWLVRIIRVPLKVEELRILLRENERLPTDEASIASAAGARHGKWVQPFIDL
jgi:hypothetical protein